MDREVSSEVAEDLGIKEIGCVVTAFEFRIGGEGTSCTVDSDGDYEVPRRKTVKILLEHRVTSSVAECGEQVWRGAVAAAKYLLKHADRFEGKRVLELGAGTGLAALAASACGAELIVATDLKERLETMRSNFERNSNLASRIEAEEFDLLKQTPERLLQTDWDFVIGADLAYDDDLTSGVIDRCREIADAAVARNVNPPKFVFCLEKRFNFTLESMSVAASAYDAFVSRLRNVFRAKNYLANESVFADEALHREDRVFKETAISDLMIVLLSQQPAACEMSEAS